MRVTSRQVVDLERRSEGRAESVCRSVGHRATSADTSTDTVPAITAEFFVNAQLLAGTQEGAGSGPLPPANFSQDQSSNPLDKSALEVRAKTPAQPSVWMSPPTRPPFAH